MRPLFLALLALAAPVALAQAPEADPGGDPPSAAAEGSAAAHDAPAAPPARSAGLERRGTGRFGLLLEAGVPEGAALSVTFRPLRAVRLWAGPAWNYVGFGVQGGVMLVPYSSVVAPSLALEAGHYFDADLRQVLDSGAGVPPELRPLLAHVGYDYLAAHVGLELGSRSFAFTLRAGLAWIRASATGTTRTTDASGNTTSDVYFSDPHLRAAVPSVKLGFQTTF